MKKFYVLIGLMIWVVFGFGQTCPTPIGVQAVINGDFESGDVGCSFGCHSSFAESGLPYSSSGYYYVGQDITTFNYGLPNVVKPHSGTKMLMVDACPTPTAIFWEQTISVIPGQTYYISAWIATLDAVSVLNPASIQFRVKGNLDASSFNVGAPKVTGALGTWNQIYTTWNSGSNTTATITFVDYNPTGYMLNGNDFAVDDIAVINSCMNIYNTPKVSFGKSTLSLCNNGGAVDLSPLLKDITENFTWFKGAINLNQNICVLKNVTEAGKYTVCIDSATCVNSATVTVANAMEINLPDSIELCSPTSLLLNTGLKNASSFNFTWSRNGTIISHDSTLFVNSPGNYKVFATDNNVCNASSTTNVRSTASIPVDGYYCSTGTKTAKLSVIGNGNYEWYDSLIGGSLIATGNSYTTSELPSGGVNYYVKDVKLDTLFAGPVDDTNLGGYGMSSGKEERHYFTATSACTIVQVTTKINFGNTIAGNVVVSLMDSASLTVLQTKTVPVISSVTGGCYVNIPVGFKLTPGHYIFQVVNGSGNLQCIFYPSASIGYPKTFGPITFTSAMPYTSWPGNFNWKLTTNSSNCDRVPVRAIELCNTIIKDTINIVKDTCFIDFAKTIDNAKITDFKVLNSKTLSLTITIWQDGINKSLTTIAHYDSTGWNVVSVTITCNDVFKANHSYTFTDEIYIDKLLPTAIPSLDESNNQFSIFPNPTTNVLSITSNKQAEYTLTLKSIEGQTVISKAITLDGSYLLDVSDVANGVYILTLQNSTEQMVKKVVVQK